MRKRCAEIRLYSGSDNIEVGRQLIDGEFVVMTSLCSVFYLLYTSRGQLMIYNSRTTQLVNIFHLKFLDKKWPYNGRYLLH